MNLTQSLNLASSLKDIHTSSGYIPKGADAAEALEKYCTEHEIDVNIFDDFDWSSSCILLQDWADNSEFNGIYFWID